MSARVNSSSGGQTGQIEEKDPAANNTGLADVKKNEANQETSGPQKGEVVAAPSTGDATQEQLDAKKAADIEAAAQTHDKKAANNQTASTVATGTTAIVSAAATALTVAGVASSIPFFGWIVAGLIVVGTAIAVGCTVAANNEKEKAAKIRSQPINNSGEDVGAVTSGAASSIEATSNAIKYEQENPSTPDGNGGSGQQPPPTTPTE